MLQRTNVVPLLLEHALPRKNREDGGFEEWVVSDQDRVLHLAENPVARGDGDLHAARKFLRGLQKKANARPETRRIGRVLLELKSLLDQIEGELDLLILRRTFKGQCRLCSVK